MLHVLFIAMLFIYSAQAQSSPEAQSIFLNANELYKQGSIEQAYQLYSRIKQPTPAVHFNLGNCAYRMGKCGIALVHWHRAEWNWGLSDREALRKNQALAHAKLLPQTPQEDEPRLLTIMTSELAAAWRAILSYARTIPLLYLQLLFIICWALVFLCSHIRLSQPLHRTLLIGSILVCFLSGSLLGLKGIAATKKQGIIVEIPAILMSGPQKSGFATLGRLNEGQEADILGESGDFYKIRTNNTTGWINKQVVEKL